MDTRPDPAYVDVVSRMYLDIPTMIRWANDPRETRPVLWCEYAHAMGNSLGSFFKFWDAIRSHDHLIGAFVWDWTDQGIHRTDKNGKTYWAYGGDFGDRINSGNFCLNGLLNPDQSLKPVAWEAKKIQQPIGIEAISEASNQFRVKNWHDFADLSLYDFTWELAENGVVIQQGSLPPLRTLPRATEIVSIPWSQPAPKPGAEYYAKLSFSVNRDLRWAPKGHVVAWAQLAIPFASPPAPLAALEPMTSLAFDVSASAITVYASAFSFAWDKASGALHSFKIGSQEIFKSPLLPNFWRPITDNDLGGDLSARSGIWKAALENRVVKSVRVFRVTEKVVKVAVTLELPRVQSEWSSLYTLYGNGELLVENEFQPARGLPDLPKLGMQVKITDDFDHLQWYGLGPYESYWDRQRSAAVGRYTASVKKDFFHYIRPQESNNHWQTRWARLTGQSDHGLLIIGGRPLSFSAWPYSTEDLETARHTHELPHRDFITLNIDHLQMGVGGDDSWSEDARPHPEFRLPAAPFRYAFRIVPVTKETAIDPLTYRLPVF